MWPAYVSTDVCCTSTNQMSNIYGKGLPGKVKRDYAKWVRQYGICEYSGRREPNLNCTHIISRTFSRTHCDPRNTFCMSASQHARFTKNPLDFAEFVLQSDLGQYVDLMREKAYQTRPKFDWFTEHDFVKYLIDNEIGLKDARENYDLYRSMI